MRRSSQSLHRVCTSYYYRNSYCWSSTSAENGDDSGYDDDSERITLKGLRDTIGQAFTTSTMKYSSDLDYPLVVSLFRHGIKKREYEFASELFQTLEEERMQITSDIMTDGLLAFSKIQDFAKCQELFAEMHQKYNISPNLEMYNTMIEVYSKQKHRSGVDQMLLSMKQNGITPDTNTSALVIDFFVDSGDVSAAFAFMESMKAIGVARDIRSYNPLLTACLVNKDLVKAEEIWAELMKNVLPNSQAYDSMIQLYHDFNMPKKIFSFYREMVEKQLIPSTKTASVLHLLESKKS